MESVNCDGDERIIAAREGGERYACSMMKEDTRTAYDIEESRVIDFLPGTW
ncbi:hypothetical protein [Paenibacillus elgii]|uniref:hypothetical protein n=1 Tax=Paenibacillus elgii TaxID=189691 RepID=UPI00167B086A|nr:hypothetical protein [Paenibacillus elgii]